MADNCTACGVPRTYGKHTYYVSNYRVRVCIKLCKDCQRRIATDDKRMRNAIAPAWRRCYVSLQNNVKNRLRLLKAHRRLDRLAHNKQQREVPSLLQLCANALVNDIPSMRTMFRTFPEGHPPWSALMQAWNYKYRPNLLLKKPCQNPRAALLAQLRERGV
jgi:hypothetical protein